MKREIIGAQGEIMIFRVNELPVGLKPMSERNDNNLPIISHSESGNHHVLDRAVEVLEHPSPPEGMRILYALLDEPTMLVQDADLAHDSHMLDAGYVEFRIVREYDPFIEQARIVAD